MNPRSRSRSGSWSPPRSRSRSVSRTPSPRPRGAGRGGARRESHYSDSDEEQFPPPPTFPPIPNMGPGPPFSGASPPPPLQWVTPQSDVGIAVKNNQSDLLKNITISRDTTSGSNFQKEKLLALNKQLPAASTVMGNRKSKTMHPMPPPPPPPPPGAIPLGYPTLNDYQSQLESENRRRQAQATRAGTYPTCMMGGPSPPQPPPARKGPAGKGPAPPMPMNSFSPDLVAMLGPSAPGLGFMPPTSKKARHPPTYDDGQAQRLLERIRVLEEENDSLKEAQGMPRKPPRYQVFHRIRGTDNKTTYLEAPTWYLGSDDEYHLKGHLPVTSKDRYLQSHRDVAFYVEKDYCASVDLKEEIKKIVRLGGEIPDPQPEHENIVLETDEMVDAAEEFFFQQPKFREEFPYLVGNLRQPIPAPYMFWYRYRSPTALDNLDSRYQELMKLLTELIEASYLEEYQRADAIFDAGLVSKKVMKYFVRPGDVVVRKENNTFDAYMATSWATVNFGHLTTDVRDSAAKDDEKDRKILTPWVVTAWKYGFDGSFYKASQLIGFEIRASKDDEATKITEMSSYPLRFADAETCAKLEQRGRTFWGCRNKKLVACLEEGDDDALLGTGERYMIDYPTYKTLHSKGQTGINRAYIPQRVLGTDGPPQGSNLYLFPHVIVGYNLRRKKWSELQVDRIRNVVWNKQAFEHLVVEPGTKELVQALVTNQISAEKSTDLIENKGNGLIMLLHGGPGTGKTFTAESVAEMAEKPLFRVTCGDIGTQAETVEKYLESVLYLGKIWGCVVLLDEADVFLEQRTLNDLTRNALVSVFLRILEYYDGILILTSNRVGTFDEAFKSRIQLALHYESLNREQRKQIWTNFFNRLEALGEKNIDYYDVEGYISILADHEMNGRQIRNAITTSRQLAQFQGQDMSYEHLKHVITVASKFDRHLSSIQDGSPEDTSGIRDDETNISKYTWADWKRLNIDDQEPATDGSGS